MNKNKLTGNNSKTKNDRKCRLKVQCQLHTMCILSTMRHSQSTNEDQQDFFILRFFFSEDFLNLTIANVK